MNIVVEHDEIRRVADRRANIFIWVVFISVV
jgi:hypothetical protein